MRADVGGIEAATGLGQPALEGAAPSPGPGDAGAQLEERVLVGGAAQAGPDGLFGRRVLAELHQIGAEADGAGDDGLGHGAEQALLLRSSRNRRR